MLEYLIKLQASPASDPRNGWKVSVRNARRGIERALKSSLNLRREVAALIADETPDGQRDVIATTRDYGEQPPLEIRHRTFTEDQVLGLWFPDDPG